MSLSLINRVSFVFTLVTSLGTLACTSNDEMSAGGGSDGMGGGVGGGDGEGGTGGGDIANQPFNASKMSNMSYTCVDANEEFFSLQLRPQGALTFAMSESPEQFVSGSYLLDGQTMSLSIPDIGLSEIAADKHVALGVLGVFATASLYCFATSFTGESEVATVLDCPLSNHIPDISYEDDEIHLRPSGNVYWRHWNNLVSANDTLYSAQNGIWIQEGDKVAMFFGNPFYESKTLTGTLDTRGLLLDQFDTTGGACQ